MIRKLLWILGLAPLVLAQQRDTVYQQLLQAVTTIAQGSKYTVSNNVGQTFHTFSIIERRNNANQNCAQDFFYAFNIASEIDASYDGINYAPVSNVRVSYQVSTNTQTSTKYYRVGGAYPYIRIQVNSIPTNLPTNCVLDINYTGSLSAPAISDSNTPETVLSSVLSSTCTVISLAALHASNPSFVQVNLLGISFSPPSTATQNIVLTTNSTNSCGAGPNGSNLYYFSMINGIGSGIPTDTTNFAYFANTQAFTISTTQYLQIGLTTSSYLANTGYTLWYVDAN